MSKHTSALTAVSLLTALLGPAMGQQPNIPDNMFRQAGFVVKFADTPAKLALLKTLPADKLVTRTKDGKTYFVYADPTGCICAYVGTAQAYRTYQTGSFEPLPGGNGVPGVPNADQMLNALGNMNEVAPGIDLVPPDIEDLFGSDYE
jgi:hypothetical protein